jgi:hypothetical protein
MPVVTIPVPLLNTGPMVIYRAPLGTTAPTGSVTGSIFTDAWASPWVALGATADGVRVSVGIETTDLEAEEFYDPLDVLATARHVTVDFTLLNFTASTRLAMHNASSSAATVTGTTTTTKTVIAPPTVGQMVRCMIGLESLDATYRNVFTSCLRTGDSQSEYRKAARAGIPFTYRAIADPTTGLPFTEALAGAARAA